MVMYRVQRSGATSWRTILQRRSRRRRDRRRALARQPLEAYSAVQWWLQTRAEHAGRARRPRCRSVFLRSVFRRSVFRPYSGRCSECGRCCRGAKGGARRGCGAALGARRRRNWSLFRVSTHRRTERGRRRHCVKSGARRGRGAAVGARRRRKWSILIGRHRSPECGGRRCGTKSGPRRVRRATTRAGGCGRRPVFCVRVGRPDDCRRGQDPGR